VATLAVIQEYCNGGHPLEQKFMAARQQVAWNILAENAGVPTAPRKAWAIKVFNNYDADLGKEYRWFLSHANVQAAGAAISDANCITAVTSFIDAWAA
jgi:hypothetical protein